jgi:hypothetical protein
MGTRDIYIGFSAALHLLCTVPCTPVATENKRALIKRKSSFLIYKEIQSGADAKSYMRKGFLIYMRKCANISPYMRRPLVICDFATAPF